MTSLNNITVQISFHQTLEKFIFSTNLVKYKSKKDYRKKQGHRQPFMRVKITSIQA